jgi:predicted DNA-binding transcriptional regulator YafY
VKLKSSRETARFIRESAWESQFRFLGFTEATGEDGNCILELSFENLYSARSFLLGWGNSIEVLEPVPLRFSLADFARQVVKVYEK